MMVFILQIRTFFRQMKCGASVGPYLEKCLSWETRAIWHVGSSPYISGLVKFGFFSFENVVCLDYEKSALLVDLLSFVLLLMDRKFYDECFAMP